MSFWFQGQQVPRSHENKSVAPWCCNPKVALTTLNKKSFTYYGLPNGQAPSRFQGLWVDPELWLLFLLFGPPKNMPVGEMVTLNFHKV